MTTVVKPRVTFGDLLLVAWRTHRTAILVAVGLVAVAAVSIVWSGASMNEWVGSGPLTTVYFGLLLRPFYVNLLFGVAIAVFWGAPLLAREHEARTNLVVWGQDASATRWLAGQVALLGAVVTCLAAAVWLALTIMVDSLREKSGGRFFEPFTGWFEVTPHVMIGYTLFGFALGLAAGALTRRTLPAMVIALFGFTAVRIAVVEWVRPYYLPPVHTFEAWNNSHQPQVPDYAMYVASGYADANGVPLGDHDWTCSGLTAEVQLDCLKAKGVAGHYAEFQPIERLGLFQWIETGIFVVLAAALLVLTWSWLKRARRV